MSTIVNSNKLKLILTQYGLDRITEALDNPTMNLNITKIKLGSGDNEEYYEPSQAQEELKGPIEGAEFYVFDKELLEDKQTVSFHTIITEDIGGFDIREVGLYETVNGVDHLFAISTQQPFVKPSSAYNYYINIDYYIFLKAANFAEVYDQITLDLEHALVSEPNLEELMRTFLFAQGNLINQIGNNSRIIGYNRATQLYERIQEDKKNFGYITLYKNFATVLDMVSSVDNIFSYWVFDYSRKESVQNSIVDLSNNNYYLSANKSLSAYPHEYYGFMSSFSFEAPNSYSLSSDVLLNLYDESTDLDSPFTMVFTIDPKTTNEDRTLIAKSDYAVGVHIFEITETVNNEVRVKLFSDNNNYLTFTSTQGIVPDSMHTLILTYDPTKEIQEMSAYVDSKKYVLNRVETGNYTHLNTTAASLYAFAYTPSIYADSQVSGEATKLYNSDGTVYSYSSSDKFHWTISEGNILCNGTPSTYGGAPTTLTFYAQEANIPEEPENPVIYTSDTDISPDMVLYSYNTETGNFEVYTGEEFEIMYDGNNYYVAYGADSTPTTYNPSLNQTLIIYSYNCSDLMQVIWSNSSSTALTVLLYNEDNSIYTGTEWTHSAETGIRFNGMPSYRRSNLDKTNFIPPLTSYITNANGNPADFVNSSIGLISVIKEKLEEENIRVLSLSLGATLGQNPYLSGGTN